MFDAVLGVGNRFRRDDALGLEVIDQLRGLLPGIVVQTSSGELTSLLESIRSHQELIVVDALQCASLDAGHIVRLAGDEVGSFQGGSSPSTHGLGVVQAIEMAKAMGCPPKRLVLYAVVGRDFTMGEGLSLEVQKAVPVVIRQIREEVDHARGFPDASPGLQGRGVGGD